MGELLLLAPITGAALLFILSFILFWLLIKLLFFLQQQQFIIHIKIAQPIITPSIMNTILLELFESET